MSRRLRWFDDPGGLVELSSRVLQGMFLMRPSEEVNDIILGVLGRAQAKYGVVLHCFTFMSNHFHILATFEDEEQMARFVGFLKSNLAKELGIVFDWKAKFWGQRYHSASVSLSEDDQTNCFRYILSNSCKEGLVDSPVHYPGVSSAYALYHGHDTMTGHWNDRTAQCHARQRGQHKLFTSTETVHLTPLPFLQARSVEERRAFVVNMVHDIERETALMHQRNGTRPLGPRAILRQHPYSRPEEFKPSPAPPFHAADPEVYREMLEARKAKLQAYREAAARLKEGETDVRFPGGCFPPRLPFVKARAPD